MKPINNRRKISPFYHGFTLIELLVVIAIIGSLSALLVPNFMGARERSRDTQRKSDLKQIQKALELYRQDQTPVAYPTPATYNPDNYSYLGVSGSSWSSATTVYMNKVPQDPNLKNTDGSPRNYYYSADNNTLTYTLCACLENKADPDPQVSSGNCGTNYSCDSQVKYVVTQP